MHDCRNIFVFYQVLVLQICNESLFLWFFMFALNLEEPSKKSWSYLVDRMSKSKCLQRRVEFIKSRASIRGFYDCKFSHKLLFLRYNLRWKEWWFLLHYFSAPMPSEESSGPSQTAKIEYFAKIFNGFLCSH